MKNKKIIKDINNLFRLKKLKDTAIKDIINLFGQEKEIEGIKRLVPWDIKNHFRYEKEEENLYKPVRVNHFWSNNYIEYKNNSDKNRILSVEEYLNKIIPYLKGIINDLKKSDVWKIQ